MRRSLVLLAILAMVVASLPVGGPAQAAVGMQRIAGPDRVATAVSVSRTGWDQSPVAFVATAYDFPDALASVALAAELDAPVLLTKRDSLPASVGEELQRLAAEEVVILGGAGAVSPVVDDEIRQLSTRPEVRRIGGSDRWQTAAMIAEQAGAPSGEAVLALGTNYPDAVAGGALAASPDQLPILLTESSRLPKSTADALRVLDVTRVYVVGGGSVVASAVDDELRAMGIEVVRLAGDSRFTTSVAVGRESLRRFEGQLPVVFATGQNFPDALSAGSFAARVGGPVVLVPSDGSGQALDEMLRTESPRWHAATVVGGPAAVSRVGAERLRRAVNDEMPLEVAEGRAAVMRWFDAMDREDWGQLRATSTGTAAVYADYVSRLSRVVEQESTRHRVVKEPDHAVRVGSKLYSLPMEVDWVLDGGRTVRLSSFTVREHSNGAFTVETFIREGRPLDRFVLDASRFGMDAGHFTIRDIRWFRAVDQSPHDLFVLMRVTNRREYSILFDGGHLETRPDDAFYSDQRWPEIPPGATRDVVFAWADVARTDAGGTFRSMVYGPGQTYEFEWMTYLELPPWPH